MASMMMMMMISRLFTKAVGEFSPSGQRRLGGDGGMSRAAFEDLTNLRTEDLKVRRVRSWSMMLEDGRNAVCQYLL